MFLNIFKLLDESRMFLRIKVYPCSFNTGCDAPEPVYFKLVDIDIVLRTLAPRSTRAHKERPLSRRLRAAIREHLDISGD